MQSRLIRLHRVCITSENGGASCSVVFWRLRGGYILWSLLPLNRWRERIRTKVLVVDIRPEVSTREVHFRGPDQPSDGRNLKTVRRELELYKDKEIYLMCHTGERSLEYVQDLIADGYDAGNVTGGYRSYLKLTLTRFVQKDSEEQLASVPERLNEALLRSSVNLSGDPLPRRWMSIS